MKRSTIVSVAIWTMSLLAAPTAVEAAKSTAKQVESFVNSFPKPNDAIRYSAKNRFSRTIYISAKSGDDKSDGLSSNKPIKSLAALAKMGIKSGDEILLKGGERHMGCIELKGITGANLHIGSYGNSKATIDFKGYPAGILVENSSNITITDLRFTANGTIAGKPYMIRKADEGKDYRHAISIMTNGAKSESVTIDNCDMKDIYYFNEGDENTPDYRPCHEWLTKGESEYGWGVRALAGKGGDINKLRITNCHISEVSHTGIKVNGRGGKINDLYIEGCTITNVGGPGSQFSGVRNGIMRHCKTVGSGSRKEPRMWGRGSGMWIAGCRGFLFEKSYFADAEGVADCCGAHIDMSNSDVVIQYCVSKNNCGGFIEILGNNKNCSYRYNISINDGWRNISDTKQDDYWMWKTEYTRPTGEKAFGLVGTPGCLVTLNGHLKNGYAGPFQNYIYNNTIVCPASRADGYTNSYHFELATSAQGALIQNNIFWIPSQMKQSKSGHKLKSGKIINRSFNFRVGELNEKGKMSVRDLTAAEIEELDFTIKNNLYKLYDPQYPRGENVLPDRDKGENRYYDEHPLGGDPKFRGVVSEQMEAEDLIPTDAKVINRGLPVEKLRTDKTPYGVKPQLKMSEDFFGNPITSPIVGACVAQ
ncbi:MAG: right-handed parallel beta-helix repeat-containing protein [Rikenellaceae bacterium]